MNIGIWFSMLSQFMKVYLWFPTCFYRSTICGASLWVQTLRNCTIWVFWNIIWQYNMKFNLCNTLTVRCTVHHFTSGNKNVNLASPPSLLTQWKSYNRLNATFHHVWLQVNWFVQYNLHRNQMCTPEVIFSMQSISVLTVHLIQGSHKG